MNSLLTQPVTIDEIRLWQESTPADYSDWDPETIADCDAFLSVLLDRLEATEATEATIERVREPALRIKQWCDAYPLAVFPEPDLKVARKGLESVGITMDQVSASNMRHVLTGITEYANELDKALDNDK